MIQEMRTNGKNGEENTRQFLFNDNTQLLKWSEVKSALQLLSKDGISMANFLETKTLYNKGKIAFPLCVIVVKFSVIE